MIWLEAAWTQSLSSASKDLFDLHVLSKNGTIETVLYSEFKNMYLDSQSPVMGIIS